MPLRALHLALTRNRAATTPDAADARLRTPVLALPRARVWETVVAVARAQPGWTVTAADAETGELRAEARTRLLRFVDDVVVRVSATGDGASRVDVASASRVGRADFGTNGRRIARFLHGLRARLAERAG